jgi:hypothetical protein
MSNTDFETNPEQPVDPIDAAIQEIVYGDPATAAQKLKAAVNQVATERDFRLACEQETRRAMAMGNKHAEQNPDIANDPRAIESITRSLIKKQAQELANAGVSFDEWERTLGRKLTDADVVARHTACRAANYPGISKAETLLEREEEEFRAWSGRSKPSSDPGVVVRQRRAESARVRGMPEPQVDPDTGARIEPVEHLSAADVTERDSGFAPGYASDPSAERRASAFQKMQFERRALRGGSTDSLRRDTA